MSTRRMYDAAYPPARPPAWEAVAGYLGGDTPHVWTRAEWDRQPARYRLGIWTRSNPAGYSGTTEGRTAAAAWRALGAPGGSTIGLDFEQAVDADYVHAFDAACVAAGYRCVLYGAESYVLHNPRPSGGYWLAHWTGTPYLDTRSSITQYAGDVQLGTDYDANLVSDSLTLWDTRPNQDDDMTPEQAAQLTTIEHAVTGHGIASAGYRLLKDGKPAEAGGAEDVHGVWNDTANGVASLLKQLTALTQQMTALSKQVTDLSGEVAALRGTQH